MKQSGRMLRVAFAPVVLTLALHGQPGNPPGANSAVPSAAQAARNEVGVLTLHTGTHMVVLDVVVTDKKGQTIPRLKPEDFHLFEDGRPQTPKFFEEHAPFEPELIARQKAELAARLPTNTFTNYEPFTGTPPMVLLLNELGSLPQWDYGPLYMRLMELVHDAPVETPFVVYELGSELRLVLPMTTDRGTVAKTLNSVWKKAGFSLDSNASDAVILDRRRIFTDAMQRLDSAFAGTPGRTTVFAFTGGLQCALGRFKQDCIAPLSGRSSAELGTYLCGVTQILEQGRISLYRYYPSGQIVYGFGCPAPPTTLRTALETNSHYYTFYYTPTNVDWNGSYRSFKVELDDKKLRAGYRAGYYAKPENTVAGHFAEATDVPGLLSAAREVKTSTSASESIPDAEQDAAPNPSPVVFTVHVDPAAEPGTGPQATPPAPGNAESERDRLKGYRDYTLRFVVPAAGLRIARELKAGQTPAYTARVEVVAVSYVRGNPADARSNQVTATFDGPGDPRIAKGAITANLTLQVPEKGPRILHVVVRDVPSRREGMLDIPVEKIVLPAK
jgi:VWFA-related protein